MSDPQDVAMSAGNVPALWKPRYIAQKYLQAPMSRLEADALIYGNDVSIYQGEMNWQINLDAGQDFAYARMCVGDRLTGFVDGRWLANAVGMDSVGHVWSPYVVFNPNNAVVDATQFWISTMTLAEARKRTIVVDAELTLGATPEKITNRLYSTGEEWLRLTGIKPWLYSAKWWWDPNILPGKDWGAVYGGFIVADYYSTGSPLMPRDWPRWDIWQYTSSLPGPAYGAQSTYIDGNRTPITKQTLKGLWTRGEVLPPVPIPGPIPIQPIYKAEVVSYSANLRDLPGMGPGNEPLGEIIGRLQKGARVAVVEESEDGEWARIDGWVYKPLVKRI